MANRHQPRRRAAAAVLATALAAAPCLLPCAAHAADAPAAPGPATPAPSAPAPAASAAAPAQAPAAVRRPDEVDVSTLVPTGNAAAVPGVDQPVGVLTGTLAKINGSGQVLVGFRQTSVPFSYVGPRGGDPIGYSIDICRAIVERIGSELHRELKIVWVPVTSDTRMQAIQDGLADLECGSTTANADRAKYVAFSPTVFVSGTKLMVRQGGGIRSYRDLAGRTIVYTAGTTNEKALRTALSKARIDARLVPADDHEQSYLQVQDGKADAFATDDVLLYGLIAAHDARERFEVVGDFLSYDPYGIMFRRDDAPMAKVVGDAIQDFAASRELEHTYNRWFTRQLPGGQRLNLPMSAQLTEMIRLMGGDIQ